MFCNAAWASLSKKISLGRSGHPYDGHFLFLITVDLVLVVGVVELVDAVAVPLAVTVAEPESASSSLGVTELGSLSNSLPSTIKCGIHHAATSDAAKKIVMLVMLFGFKSFMIVASLELG